MKSKIITLCKLEPLRSNSVLLLATHREPEYKAGPSDVNEQSEKEKYGAGRPEATTRILDEDIGMEPKVEITEVKVLSCGHLGSQRYLTICEGIWVQSHPGGGLLPIPTGQRVKVLRNTLQRTGDPPSKML